MTHSFTKLRQAGLMLAVAFTVSVASSPSFAASAAEGRAVCGGDALRLCAGEIPNLTRVAICLVSKKSQVSAPCRAFIDREMPARSGKVATND